MYIVYILSYVMRCRIKDEPVLIRVNETILKLIYSFVFPLFKHLYIFLANLTDIQLLIRDVFNVL